MDKKREVFKKLLIGPLGIVLLNLLIIFLWFHKGLLFASGEEGLSFYNPTRSLDLFSYIWYNAGTGFFQLVNVTRIPYFVLLSFFYSLGIPNVVLQAFTFFAILTVGTLSVYYLVKNVLKNCFEETFLRKVSFISAIFYFLNPFSTTLIWGRSLTFQILSFALVPALLLFFILGIQRRNWIFIVFAALTSFILSGAYSNPAIVITSWSSIVTYFVYYIYTNRRDSKKFIFAVSYFAIFFLCWCLANFFWLNPLIKHGKEMLDLNVQFRDNIEVLKGVSVNSTLKNLLRLIHREYYDGTYGEFVRGQPFVFLTWLVPLIALFSIKSIKKCQPLLFFVLLFIISIVVTLGSNPPTGWFLEHLFRAIPILQVLRNSYEKFGINLLLAYTPFFAIGAVIISEKVKNKLKKEYYGNLTLITILSLVCGLLVWPLWTGYFAGGKVYNSWVSVPKYYEEANEWFNKQPGDFYILHVPIAPFDSVTFSWKNGFDGIEPSEYLFDKASIARNLYDNRDYYTALVERLGWANAGKYEFSKNNLDFKDTSFLKELAKLNVRYIVLHNDTNYKKRLSVDPKTTANYLEQQKGINKVKVFDKLEVYKVEIDPKINLIYSPETDLKYQRLNETSFVIDVKSDKSINILLLKQFDKNWIAYSNDRVFKEHSKVFSYANAWNIDKVGAFKVYIKYKAQDEVDFGMAISKLSLLTMGITLMLFFIRRKVLSK